MKIAITAAALGAAALLGISGSMSARATEIEVYRTNHDGSNCRVIETHTTNRWGDDVTIRQRVCT
jgi:hypothetical protein